MEFGSESHHLPVNLSKILTPIAESADSSAPPTTYLTTKKCRQLDIARYLLPDATQQ